MSERCRRWLSTANSAFYIARYEYECDRYQLTYSHARASTLYGPEPSHATVLGRFRNATRKDKDIAFLHLNASLLQAHFSCRGCQAPTPARLFGNWCPGTRLPRSSYWVRQSFETPPQPSLSPSASVRVHERRDTCWEHRHCFVCEIVMDRNV